MMRKAIYIIAITTLACSYGSFKVLKEMSNSSMLYYVEYYHLFTGFEHKKKAYSAENEFINYAVQGYTNKDLADLRSKVFLVTLIAFVLSLIPGYRAFKKQTSESENPTAINESEDVEKNQEEQTSVNDPKVMEELLKKYSHNKDADD